MTTEDFAIGLILSCLFLIGFTLLFVAVGIEIPESQSTKTVVDKIFQAGNFTYNSDFFESPYFKRLILPYTGEYYQLDNKGNKIDSDCCVKTVEKYQRWLTTNDVGNIFEISLKKYFPEYFICSGVMAFDVPRINTPFGGIMRVAKRRY